MNKKILGIILLCFFGLISCKHEPPEVKPEPQSQEPIISQGCSPDTVYFLRDIQPLLEASCATSGCHNAASAAEGVILTDYKNIISTGGVIAGNPSASELYQQIITNKMPPNNPLTQQQKNLIQTWISQGAKYNGCIDTVCDTTAVSYSRDIVPILTDKCTGCHGTNSINGNPPVKLDTYTNVLTEVNNGRFLGSITGAPNYVKMPPSGSLSQCELDKIKKWINNGAPNN